MTQTTLFHQEEAKPPKPAPTKEPKIVGVFETFEEVREFSKSYANVPGKTIEFAYSPGLGKYIIREVYNG